MILRIVKMSFQPEKTGEFLAIFNTNYQKISGFNGCCEVRLLNDTKDSSVFMTYSIWNSANDLEAYRQSDLFNTVWSKTKLLFKDKPMAWSIPYN